jgi:hypothetical protein
LFGNRYGLFELEESSRYAVLFVNYLCEFGGGAAFARSAFTGEEANLGRSASIGGDLLHEALKLLVLSNERDDTRLP